MSESIAPTPTRPRSVAVVAWIFIIVGVVAFLGGVIPPSDATKARYVAEMKAQHPGNDLLVDVIRILAVVGGIFILRGHNWARWTMAVWMALHVWIGALKGLWTIPVHLVMFGLMGYYLFRPAAAGWFRKNRQGP